jgi:hypothetical protein
MRHSQEGFFDGLQMPVFSFIFDFGDFDHALTEHRHFLAEHFFHGLHGDIAIFHHIMQQARLDGLYIGFDLHEEFCRFERMDDVWFTG